MSELHDRVNAIKKQQAEQARAKHEESLGWPIGEPNEEQASIIREFLRNYKGPWEKQDIWAPDGKDHLYGRYPTVQPSHTKRWRKHNVREVECVVIRDDGYMDGSFPSQYILRDGRVSGGARHEDLVNQLAKRLAV